jgi:hypothetical protein
MATMNRLQVRGDRDLARLDAICGKDATYYVNQGDVLDDDGNIVPDYEITEGVRVRLVAMTTAELSRLSAAGIERFDTIWRMRRAYYGDARPDHILKVDGEFYEVLENGVFLDILGLLYTLATRRRPPLV